MANEFGFCRKTFRKRLHEAGISLPNGLVSPACQKLIYESLWYPDEVSREDYNNVTLPEQRSPK